MSPLMKPRLAEGRRPDKPGDRRPLPARGRCRSLWYLLGLFLLLAVAQAYLFMPPGRAIPYSEFKALLAQDKVAEVVITGEAIRGTLKGADGGGKARRVRRRRASRIRSSSRNSSSTR